MFKNLQVRTRDEYEFAVVPQCSSYCIQMENRSDTQLILLVQQWKDDVKVKEDFKSVKIASDLRKQVSLKEKATPCGSQYTI